jgi:sigma-B regulation protein RsbU (phosphoserine phosphatase)
MDWQEKLARVIETVREVSAQTDPQLMVQAYRQRMARIRPTDQVISLSRRDLAAPKYRITRNSRWADDVNPWTQKHRLPVFESGLLAELLYADEPQIIDELDVDPADPLYDELSAHRSLAAIPQYDDGKAINMVVLLRNEPGAFDREQFPDLVLATNLFGRATHSLLLASQLRDAYSVVDRELQAIAEIQRGLLPSELPTIPTMELAAHYQTARRAGGDYYDFFQLDGGKWGILIADVSGHGSPAAVLMAVTHSLAHAFCHQPTNPSEMLEHLNERLCRQYTTTNGLFVTAWYAVYDPAKRELAYASAGHNPPRVKRCEDGSIFSLDKVGGMPLGIMADEEYEAGVQTLRPGDQIIFYTDGITEAMNPKGEMFGPARLDDVLSNCTLYASGLIQRLLESVDHFTEGHPADDDRTVLVAKIS